MVTRVSVRDLRNSTRDVIERVRLTGEVILTSNGEDVAVMHPISTSWAGTVDDVFRDAPPPRDTGMAAWLEADNLANMADLA